MRGKPTEWELMYHGFFSLDHDPFRLTPSADVVFHHPSFERARAYLEYGLMRGEGFVVVTGDPGCGKTTLVQDLLVNVPSGTDVVQIVTSRVGPEDLLRLTASGFGLTPEHRDKATLLTTLQRDLENRAIQGRRSLLVVDEAQDLEREALEELRLLTNLTRNDAPLVQILLLGQPPLREMINRPEMEQFHQRLIASCRLAPLTEAQTRDYVHFRLERAGWEGDPALSEAVFRLMHIASGGIPRRINLLAGRLLLDAFADSRHEIRVTHLRDVLLEMEDEALEPAWREAYDEIEAAEVPPPSPPIGRKNPGSNPPAEPAYGNADGDEPTPTIAEPEAPATHSGEDHAKAPDANPDLPPLRATEPEAPAEPREPVLTDIVYRGSPPDDSNDPGIATNHPGAGRHSAAVVAGVLAVIALLIVVATATPAFDGIRDWVMGWYQRLLGSP